MTIQNIDWTPEFQEQHTFYGREGDEHLSHTNIGDYIDELIGEGTIEPEEAIKTNEAVTVYAYTRVQVPRPQSRLSQMLDEISEAEGMLDPDADHDLWTDAEIAELEAMESVLIDRLVELCDPWGCDLVAETRVPFRDYFESLSEEDQQWVLR